MISEVNRKIDELQSDLEEAVELIAKTVHIYPTDYDVRTQHKRDLYAFLERMKERGLYS